MAPAKRVRKAPATRTVHPNGAVESVFQLEAPADIHRDPPQPVARGTRRATAATQPISERVNHLVTCENQEADTEDNLAFTLRPLTPLGQAGSSEGEHFATPSPTSSAESLHVTLLGLTIASTDLPCSGPHSRQRRRQSISRSHLHSHNPAEASEDTETQPANTKVKQKRAIDVWTFFEKRSDSNHCTFCLKAIAAGQPVPNTTCYSTSTSTTGLADHLADFHISEWYESCERLGITISRQGAQGAIKQYLRTRGVFQPSMLTIDPTVLRDFSTENFADALVEWIVGDDQSLNVVECSQLRAIFLMLRDDLQDKDIPHCTAIRARIMQTWEEHVQQLSAEMKTSIGKISFTSDIWSDTNLSPFMAVTAHWIESKPKVTINGTQHILSLRADLIGFHHMPGHHSGEHLAQAFIYVVNRLGITQKTGWITLDNASNNDTLVLSLERALKAMNVPFCHVENCIRCFPHIVNLACQAVLSKITDIDFAKDDAPEFVPFGPNSGSFIDALHRDPIATVRALIRNIRVSSLRRQGFSEAQDALNQKHLQLLRDVVTRWSSTYLMIERALELRDAVDLFLKTADFRDLRDKYALGDAEWKALQVFKAILEVPHAFQQVLSAKITPSLCNALPAFEAMHKLWTEYQAKIPEARSIIQAGLDKLSLYGNRAELNSTYVLAMAVNPAMKLMYYSQISAEKAMWAKQVFLDALRKYYLEESSDNPPRQPASPSKKDRIDAIGLLNLNRFNNLTQRLSRTLDEEVDEYMLDSQIGTGMLNFWQENQLRYPTIFQLAMDIIPIQGSAVPCERVFSSARETMQARRNKLGPDTMEALQMLKFLVKKGRSLNFSLGMTKAEEMDILAELP